MGSGDGWGFLSSTALGLGSDLPIAPLICLKRLLCSNSMGPAEATHMSPGSSQAALCLYCPAEPGDRCWGGIGGGQWGDCE